MKDLPPEMIQNTRQPTSHNHYHRSSGGQSKSIILYTIGVCLSCLYLQTQQFKQLLNDSKANYMAILTYFDVAMCLLSYLQTIRINNRLLKLSKIDPNPVQIQKFYDYSYSSTRTRCTPCNNFKFPRVSHCSSCGQCQYKMDHHCIWTQTCIGYRNQKSFYLFCFYMSIGVIQFWYFSIRVWSERTRPLLQLTEPGVLILWAFTAFSAFFVGIMIIALLISHTILVLTNYRTLDGMKSKKMCPLPFCRTYQPPEAVNLFDRGQIQNLKAVFGNKWWLWWIPTARQLQNQIFPEPMAPHPDRLSLSSTHLYDLQDKFREQMQHLRSRNLLSLFLGKKMKINDSIFHIISPNQSSQDV